MECDELNMTIDDMIEVLQAAKDGKRIQIRLANDSNYAWVDHMANFFNFSKFDYRVVPKPQFLKGYCFAKDIYETPTIGMVKVEQVSLAEGENPLPRKPLEFWLTPWKSGLCFVSEHKVENASWHVREVINERSE